MVDDDESQNPVVVQQVDLAVVPYQGLLPEEVVQDFAWVLARVLDAHPVGMSLVARLTPGGHPPIATNRDPKSRGFEGFAAVHVLCDLLQHIADKTRKTGDTRFVGTDGARRVLKAFLSYLNDADGEIWRLSDEAAKLVAAAFGATIVGCLFMGTVREVEARPKLATAWGDMGRALLEALPGALVVLKGALGRLENGHRAFLQSYLACDWDAKRLAQRSGKHERVINDRCVDAMRELGLALRAELQAHPPPRRGPSVARPS